MNADRELVDRIKARQAEGLCRVCGYVLDAERNCFFCGHTEPVREHPDGKEREGE